MPVYPRILWWMVDNLANDPKIYSLDLRVSRCQFLTLLHVLEFCLQPGETRNCGGYAHIYIHILAYTIIHIQYTYTVGWLYKLLEIV